MGNFIQVKETRYNDTFVLNIDNVVIINFNSNYILVNGVHGEGNGNFTLDDDSMAKLYAAIKQPPHQLIPIQAKDVDSSPSLEESKRIIEQFAPTPSSLREQIQRLIVENRNSLNDPTTNEPHDVKGIADDVVALIKLQQEALLSDIREEAYRRASFELKAHAPGVIVNPAEVKWSVFEARLDKLRLEL